MWVYALLTAGVAAAVGGGAVCVRRRRQAVQKYRAAEKEQVEILPDARNEYLRSRLQTTLAVAAEEQLPSDANLLHAQKLLYTLLEKRMSGADSLIARKLQKDLGRYAAKEYYSAYERGELSGLLSKLLTLCAKYEI